MKPTEKLPELLEFFNIIARIRRLNEVFRLSSRIRYLYEVLCFILIVFDGFFLFITVIFPLKSGTLQAVATFDAVVVLFLWVEYLFRVNEQDDKWRYVAYQWSDILAIIPFDYIALVSFGIALPLTIAFKLLRLVRIVALLRFSRRIEREVLAFAEKTRLIYGLAIYLLVIIVGALLFFYIESPVNPTVSHAERRPVVHDRDHDDRWLRRYRTRYWTWQDNRRHRNAYCYSLCQPRDRDNYVRLDGEVSSGAREDFGNK